MVKLIEITSHADLVTEIVAQFAFMKIMSEPQDHSFNRLEKLSLDEIYSKADDFFVQFTDELGMITTSECELDKKITEFLKEWESVTDVTAIHQNINYRLKVLDQDS